MSDITKQNQPLKILFVFLEARKSRFLTSWRRGRAAIRFSSFCPSFWAGRSSRAFNRKWHAFCICVLTSRTLTWNFWPTLRASLIFNCLCEIQMRTSPSIPGNISVKCTKSVKRLIRSFYYTFSQFLLNAIPWSWYCCLSESGYTSFFFVKIKDFH